MQLGTGVAYAHPDTERETMSTVGSANFKVRLFGNQSFKKKQNRIYTVSWERFNFQYLISFLVCFFFSVTIIGGIVFLAFAFSALFISPDSGF